MYNEKTVKTLEKLAHDGAVHSLASKLYDELYTLIGDVEGEQIELCEKVFKIIKKASDETINERRN